MDKELEKILIRYRNAIGEAKSKHFLPIRRIGAIAKVDKKFISQIKSLCREKAKECVEETYKSVKRKEVYDAWFRDECLRTIDQKFK